MTSLAARLSPSLLPRWGRAVGVAVALLAAWAVAAAVLPNGAPTEIVLQGVIWGSANALTAFGLILIWRANRVVNFAVAAMGGLAGGFGIHLFRDWGWNYGISIVCGVLAGMLVGGLVEFG